jgi:hypothetical protein
MPSPRNTSVSATRAINVAIGLVEQQQERLRAIIESKQATPEQIFTALVDLANLASILLHVIARFLYIACHCTAELRINLVGNRHHVWQQQRKSDVIEILVERLEDANLQDARLFHHHRSRVALFTSNDPMFRSIL